MLSFQFFFYFIFYVHTFFLLQAILFQLIKNMYGIYKKKQMLNRKRVCGVYPAQTPFPGHTKTSGSTVFVVQL